MSISNLNIQIIGRLGQDSTIREVGEYFAISFSVAVSEKRKNGDEVTSWFNCTYWSKSNKISKYLTKGKLVSVVADWFEITEKDSKTYTNFRVKDLNPFLEKSENKEDFAKSVKEEEDDLPF